MLRKGGHSCPLRGKVGDRNVPAPLSLFFDDLLGAKVRKIVRQLTCPFTQTPIFPTSGPAQWLFQGPPKESKFLATQRRRRTSSKEPEKKASIAVPGSGTARR